MLFSLDRNLESNSAVQRCRKLELELIGREKSWRSIVGMKAENINEASNSSTRIISKQSWASMALNSGYRQRNKESSEI